MELSLEIVKDISLSLIILVDKGGIALIKGRVVRGGVKINKINKINKLNNIIRDTLQDLI